MIYYIRGRTIRLKYIIFKKDFLRIKFADRVDGLISHALKAYNLIDRSLKKFKNIPDKLLFNYSF
tara:strand:- start:591 stop:785 length:195 start_codon:yes stop_codon:yes gene_type:complete